MASGVKRSLFSKPAWAAPSATKSESHQEGGSIFSRNVAYDEIVRGQKAERERKAAKAKARTERQKSKENSKDKSEEPDYKKRKISTEPDDLSDWDSDGVQKEKPRQRIITRSTPKKDRPSRDITPDTPHSRRRKSGKATMINLGGDEDDDELIMLTPPKPRKTTPKKSKTKTKDKAHADDDSSEEDDYLRELKQKAREKARLQREQGNSTEKIKSPETIIRDNSAAVGKSSTHSASTEQHQSRPTSSSAQISVSSKPLPASKPQPQDDPEIKILINSEIPNAKSLIVKRKASQSLRQVKEFWCRKFDLEDSVARQVFFTWNGTRLFDSTTMRGIIRGLKKDHYQKQRSVSLDEEGSGDGDSFDERTAKDPSNGNIMLEAMTREIYDRKMREKEKAERQAEAPDESIEEDEEATLAAQALAAAEREKDAGAIIIRLVSNDKNLEPLQLRVRPHTTVGKIMRGYAATRNVEEGKTPWLIYDGERLEQEMTVEELGLEDEEQVEVSIR